MMDHVSAAAAGTPWLARRASRLASGARCFAAVGARGALLCLEGGRGGFGPRSGWRCGRRRRLRRGPGLARSRPGDPRRRDHLAASRGTRPAAVRVIGRRSWSQSRGGSGDRPAPAREPGCQGGGGWSGPRRVWPSGRTAVQSRKNRHAIRVLRTNLLDGFAMALRAGVWTCRGSVGVRAPFAQEGLWRAASRFPPMRASSPRNGQMTRPKIVVL